MEIRGAIKIVMDHREVNETLKRTLLMQPYVKLEVQTLAAGDFLIDNLLLIERKTFKDFVTSIKDGRIFRQAVKLASGSKHNLIILEGTSQDVKSTQMKREAIQGALISLSLKFRIPVLRSISPEETGNLMISAYQQLTLCKSRLPYRPVGYKHSSRFKQQIHILQGLPGVGPAKAKMLLDKLGSLKAVFNASVSDLKEIDGMGKCTAERICSIIEEEI